MNFKSGNFRKHISDWKNIFKSTCVFLGLQILKQWIKEIKLWRENKREIFLKNSLLAFHFTWWVNYVNQTGFREKLAEPYNSFSKYRDCSKFLTDLEIEEHFSRLAGGIPNQEDITWTNKIIEKFDFKARKEPTRLCCKLDTILINYALLWFKEDCLKTYGLDPFCFVSIPVFTCEGNWTKRNVDYICNQYLNISLENRLLDRR